jgi:glutathione S-transferase
MASSTAAFRPLSWQALAALASAEPDRVQGEPSAQADLRLFGQPASAVRVTLYRDHHAWCPYCQKVWLWLEERRVPYRVRKVTMFCYGRKEPWYLQRVPSGMLPAVEIDGRVVTESDTILETLERCFGSLAAGMNDGAVLPLRRLERQLFQAWCQWLCRPLGGSAAEARAEAEFDRWAGALAAALEARPGPFLLGELGTADLVFVPYVERMSASLTYFKGYLLRKRHPAIDRWFQGLEQRPSYRATQSDFHTHAHDLPPQMGGCFASGSEQQRQWAHRIDRGPWPLGGPEQPDPETSQAEPPDAAARALARVLRHREPLLDRYGGGAADGPFAEALRAALTLLIRGEACPPPGNTAALLRSLMQSISVPRDMPLHAARRLRQALEHTACLDPVDAQALPIPLPLQHRRDQDPLPFLQAGIERRIAA